jgi:DNA ligase (NAD+)
MAAVSDRKEIDAVRTTVRRWEAAYRDGNPLVSDTVFDEKYRWLQENAPWCPEVREPMSGSALLSLNNGDLDDWYDYVVMKLGTNPALVVQPKIDGATLALRYNCGLLVDAYVRSGKKVYEMAEQVPSIPKIISAAGDIEIIGELHGDPSITGEKGRRVRPDRSASTAIRNNSCGDRLMKFHAFRLIQGAGTESTGLSIIHRLGFQVVDSLVHTTKEEINKTYRKWQNKEIWTSLPTDGIVIKVHSVDMQKRLGEGFKAPVWAYALK